MNCGYTVNTTTFWSIWSTSSIGTHQSVRKIIGRPLIRWQTARGIDRPNPSIYFKIPFSFFLISPSILRKWKISTTCFFVLCCFFWNLPSLKQQQLLRHGATIFFFSLLPAPLQYFLPTRLNKKKDQFQLSFIIYFSIIVHFLFDILNNFSLIFLAQTWFNIVTEVSYEMFNSTRLDTKYHQNPQVSLNSVKSVYIQLLQLFIYQQFTEGGNSMVLLAICHLPNVFFHLIM